MGANTRKCRHGDAVDDCEKTCQACGHGCDDHDQESREKGRCNHKDRDKECDCPDWSEPV
jgi:hypothetical protein